MASVLKNSQAKGRSMHTGLGDIGVIGLGVMGSNLALNIEEHGYSVSVWNLDPSVTRQFIEKQSAKSFVKCESLEELVESLKRPRRILMMIKAGSPVDETLGKLKPLLTAGDIVLDGGNSWFRDTERRERELKEEKIYFFGLGVSGGEEGARSGPSLMPGGDRSAYQNIEPILDAIAAKSENGLCVSYIGPGGAGHFVKMVHNGIEYGDMQLIAESYDILRKCLGMRPAELASIFSEWNRGPLESFLISITEKIFLKSDPDTDRPLIDLILDKAGQKGTGKWTAQTALDLSVPVPTISAAIDARVISSYRETRVELGKIYNPKKERLEIEKELLVGAVHDALLASRICTYAQGMDLIQKGSIEYQWDINPKEVARIWTAGCIIRAKLLNTIMAALERNPGIPNLLMDAEISKLILDFQKGWRVAVSTAQSAGVPVPAMAASLSYFHAYTEEKLPQNLIQAQRDLFGSHTYERIDKPGSFHTDWN
jgi:6-phosphogluconate dehydrogenase